MKILTLNMWRKLAGVAVAAMVLPILSPDTFANPRPPGPPLPEAVLQQWSFDDAYYSSSGSNAVPVDATLWAESWSGYALVRSGRSTSPLSVPMAITNRWNVMPEQGAIRVWFSSGWSSATTRSTGPGQKATLLDLSLVSGSDALVVWSLYATADGGTLKLDAQGDGVVSTVLSANVGWIASQWHLITLSYSGTETLLYIDNTLAASGGVLPQISPTSAATGGLLTIGSAVNGAYAAMGEFDELTTFSQEIKAGQLASYYTFRRPTVDLGPVTPAEEQARASMLAQAKADRAAGLTSAATTSMSLMSFQAMDTQTGLYLLTPMVQGTNIVLAVQGGKTNESYNVLFSPVLFDGMTNSDWATVAVGAFGQTNFAIPISGDTGFFQLQIVNGIPVWQLADPNNPNSGLLTLTIDTPANGSTMR